MNTANNNFTNYLNIICSNYHTPHIVVNSVCNRSNKCYFNIVATQLAPDIMLEAVFWHRSDDIYELFKFNIVNHTFADMVCLYTADVLSDGAASMSVHSY